MTSVPSKVFGRVLIDRIRDGGNSKLRDEQAGFRSGRGTVEHIFILRNIIEQVVERQATLYITFVDFEKAFDSVHRESLWKIMESYGIPCKIIHMVQMLYEDSECAVLDEGEESEWFKVKTGVKQGDVMSGFIIHVISFMSSCCTHMQTKTRQLNQCAARTGLRINKKKTQILRLNSKCENRILIDDQELKEVDKYNYLGANVSKQGGGGDDIVNRICKARVSFMKLKQIWGSNIYTLRSKLRLFNTLVKPVLLYGSETWKINEGDNRKLDTFFSSV